MMVWATVSPFLQVSVPPQYLQHIDIIYNISTLYLHYLQNIYTISTLSTHLSTLAMAGVVGVTQLEVNSPLLLPPSQSDSIDIVDISLLSPATWYEHVVRAAGGHPRPRVVVGGGAADLEGVRVGAGVPGDAAVALLPPDAHLQCCMSPATTPPCRLTL